MYVARSNDFSNSPAMVFKCMGARGTQDKRKLSMIPVASQGRVLMNSFTPEKEKIHVVFLQEDSKH